MIIIHLGGINWGKILTNYTQQTWIFMTYYFIVRLPYTKGRKKHYMGHIQYTIQTFSTVRK